jgi:ubiquinone/menaquinone biosynthesis C-methylase UbiE
MTSPWEFEDDAALFAGLVGGHVGEHPERHVDRVRQSREEVAGWLLEDLSPRPTDIAMEIGSGCGFISKPMSRAVHKLHCVDISESFLEYARRECVDCPNIEFHKIESADLGAFPDRSIDFAFAHAVFMHLNVYDFYLYFAEIARVLKRPGKLWIDIMSVDRLDMSPASAFLHHVEAYRRDRLVLPNLLCWNSPEAVMKIAEHFGFRLIDGGTNHFLFSL